ncbi:hypothetical protein RHSIM_Rhsim04G0182000 [Rhododendron simsii]|uniref:Uncharacterized protein n=1 Tax=Rhododendron simsii TaxID=118357 RepID=A0A834H180_RHOSS|nr:hypothetical protein RHSIM_Rhsim04G0182000 [Rhododendron simsii]
MSQVGVFSAISPMDSSNFPKDARTTQQLEQQWRMTSAMDLSTAEERQSTAEDDVGDGLELGEGEAVGAVEGEDVVEEGVEDGFG